jgi:hypothetical protein
MMRVSLPANVVVMTIVPEPAALAGKKYSPHPIALPLGDAPCHMPRVASIVHDPFVSSAMPVGAVVLLLVAMATISVIPAVTPVMVVACVVLDVCAAELIVGALMAI